eukprot:CAMPEP_0172484638 /NCGR_PEP_ID=MMETSP1066-20121228/12176_1 /TAXON_ID=671091 /ORGANISM="Coscinodiscus wailesii, Strain CCMP2513" /LENGTH=93 /DNA_ID=CAMNT_0013249287 /DNA_START=105 /DNA_END=386 /DNA_ORIENTATION=+
MTNETRLVTTLQRRWSSELGKAGLPEDAPDSPNISRRLTVSGNPWSDCHEVEKLYSSCLKDSAGLGKGSAICMTATRFMEGCIERDCHFQDAV